VSWIAHQVDEIRSDRALTFYGVALALANVVTSYQWQFRSGVPQMIGGSAMPFCWPFWENCQPLLSVHGVNRVLWVYLALSAGAAVAFARHRVGTGYWLLLTVNLLRTLVMVQDYRLRANQHYMLNWLVLAFLFLPAKRALLHHVVVSLYFWAGALKLDREWLTGVALYNQDRLWLPAALVPASCVYVVILETTIVFGTYARRSWIFWAALSQLALFHVFSWPIVGFWYPTLMFCLIAILPLTRLLHPPAEWITFESLGVSRHRLAAAATIGSLAALQFVPRAFPGDSAVTGEGRVFALHMFDALIVCDAQLIYRMDDGRQRARTLDETVRMPHRSRCDPVVYFDIAKNACRARPTHVVDFELHLRSKHASDAAYQDVIDIGDFCAANPTYDMWRHNAWIEPAQAARAAARLPATVSSWNR
jgi:hypothetical protein